MKRPIARAGTVVLVAVAVCGLVVGAQRFHQKSAARAAGSQHKIVPLDVSWARLYGSIGELKRASVAIVLGTVESAGRSYQSGGIPNTGATLSVTKVLWQAGSPTIAPGQSIIVQQTGGILNGQIYEIPEDPLFQTGEQVILFLKGGPSEGGHYDEVSPEGRFKVVNGLVSAGSSLHVGSFTGSVPLNSFEQTVANS